MNDHIKESTANKTLIRQVNLTLILKLIREESPISRASLARRLGLNPATISSNVKILLNEGLIREVGAGTSSGGRKPILLEIDQSARYVIGVDVQKDKVVVAVVTLDGTILCSKEQIFVTHFSKETVLSTIYSTIDSAISCKYLDLDICYGIGVGMHGIVDVVRGISIFAPAFAWHNVEIQELLEERYKVPVKIDNDARAMALGEKWFGCTGDIDDFLFINIGGGIGGGLFIGGKVHRGYSGTAGEIGHIKVAENGKKCVCGNSGCLDTEATVKSILDEIEEVRTQSADSWYNDSLREGRSITINDVSDAAIAGDVFTRELLHRVGYYLGRAISDVLAVVNPQMIVIGGEISPLLDFILPTLKETLESFSLQESLEGMEIKGSSLHEKAGIIGAATLIIQRVFKGPVVH